MGILQSRKADRYSISTVRVKTLQEYSGVGPVSIHWCPPVIFASNTRTTLLHEAVGM